MIINTVLSNNECDVFLSVCVGFAFRAVKLIVFCLYEEIGSWLMVWFPLVCLGLVGFPLALLFTFVHLSCHFLVSVPAKCMLDVKLGVI